MMKLNLPESVNIVEVGPRDGLQNEKTFLATDKKIELINLLSKTGLTTIEATSFVRPDRIPQLADSAEVFAGITKQSNINYPVLVPNMDGLERAIQAGAKDISVFIAASETFSQKNTNCSISDSLQRVSEVCQHALQAGLRVRGYLSCVFGCPYEGHINDDVVLKLKDTLLDIGCYEVSLGDTIGVATPGDVMRVLTKINNKKNIAMHFHDTYGQALANVLASLQMGVSTFDSSIGGLGGCPYANGATGNLATEDLVYMLHGLEIKTSIDVEKLLTISSFVKKILPESFNSRVANALLSEN